MDGWYLRWTVSYAVTSKWSNQGVARNSAGNLRWLGYGHDKDELEWEKQAGPWFEILSPARSILLREVEVRVSVWPSPAGRLNGKGAYRTGKSTRPWKPIPDRHAQLVRPLYSVSARGKEALESRLIE
jgi:hypothetical protein